MTTHHNPPRILSEDLLHENPFFSLMRRLVQFAGGAQKDVHVMTVPNSVMVILLDQDNTVIFVRELCHAVHGFRTMACKGRIDEGETPEAAAHREVGEELGLLIGKLTFLGKIEINPCYVNGEMSVFLGKSLIAAPQLLQQPEGHPPIVPVRVSLDQAMGALETRANEHDEPIHASTAAALFMVQRYLKKTSFQSLA